MSIVNTPGEIAPAPVGGNQQSLATGDLAFVHEETGATRSADAFRKDLPELLRSAPGRWVAYAHGNRVRIAGSQTELYRYCLDELDLEHDEFIVACIVPDDGGEIVIPLR